MKLSKLHRSPISRDFMRFMLRHNLKSHKNWYNGYENVDTTRTMQ